MSINEFEKGVLEEYRRGADAKSKHTNKVIMMLIITLMIAIVGMVTMHGITLLYLYQYDFSTEVTTTETTTVEQDGSDGSHNNYIGGDGSVQYSETKNY